MVATALVATIVLGAWTYLVVSYESPLGTDNVVAIDRSPTSNGTSDILATLSFEDGAEDLDWASMLIEIQGLNKLTRVPLAVNQLMSMGMQK